MLVITRKIGESVVIETETGPIYIKVIKARGSYCRLGFDDSRCKSRLKIHRAEYLKPKQSLNNDASNGP